MTSIWSWWAFLIQEVIERGFQHRQRWLCPRIELLLLPGLHNIPLAMARKIALCFRLEDPQNRLRSV
jgi:hypothetical protein